MGEKVTGMVLGAAVGCLFIYMIYGSRSDKTSGKILGFACGSLAAYMFTSSKNSI